MAGDFPLAHGTLRCPTLSSLDRIQGLWEDRQPAYAISSPPRRDLPVAVTGLAHPTRPPRAARRSRSGGSGGQGIPVLVVSGSCGAPPHSSVRIPCVFPWSDSPLQVAFRFRVSRWRAAPTSGGLPPLEPSASLAFSVWAGGMLWVDRQGGRHEPSHFWLEEDVIHGSFRREG